MLLLVIRLVVLCWFIVNLVAMLVVCHTGVSVNDGVVVFVVPLMCSL